ncbi:uncharacterized protein LOC111332849 isoform X2 [Stylophora pistillata]|uniref:uncharacterized protein LOC111332849 isoform X2 n=1 Tax=Stylophora pistillata TaxID=50429 RepID=UPI000C052717|nr:uncharacterized protein LOC111332849 isoform X2 [Stylophora pistillata]
MMEEIDPCHLGVMGKKAMELHKYPDAIRLFSMGLVQAESLNLPPQFASQFLMDRAECHWQLGEVNLALQQMDKALRHGLPRNANFAEEESARWSAHGFAHLETYEYTIAESCARFALHFQTLPRTRAHAYLCQAIARYEMGKITGETTETKEIKRLDPNLAKLHALEMKENAIRNMKSHNYPRAIRDFNFALLLHPDDGSKREFKRSVKSHQADAYFKLKQYQKAIEVGEESYKSYPDFRSSKEAERWKKRGNDLWKDSNLVDQAITCYSLALKFTPAIENVLKATLFSNRSLMYNQQGKAALALRDALSCMENNPRWPKARIDIVTH